MVNTERIVTDAITGGKHEGGGERALNKQEVVVGQRAHFFEEKRELPYSACMPAA